MSHPRITVPPILRLLFSLTLLLLLFAAAATADTVVVTVAPPIPSTVPDFTSSHKFTSAILNSTNFYRAEHNASDVTWNKTLASYASHYLTTVGTASSSSSEEDTCDFAHSGGPYGENIAMGYANATATVEAWGEERDDYDWGDPGFSEDTGHFTQLVWRDTREVGCGRRLCGTSGWFVVCEYWPRGNVVGEFKDEVDKESVGVVVKATWMVVVVAVVMIVMVS